MGIVPEVALQIGCDTRPRTHRNNRYRESTDSTREPGMLVASRMDCPHCPRLPRLLTAADAAPLQLAPRQPKVAHSTGGGPSTAASASASCLMSFLVRQSSLPTGTSRIKSIRPRSRQAVVFAPGLLRQLSDEGARTLLWWPRGKTWLHLFPAPPKSFPAARPHRWHRSR